MPDNRAVSIYRKSWEAPVNTIVRSYEVTKKTAGGMPLLITFKGEDGREGTIYINPDETEAVVISPVGDPNKD